MIVFFHTAAFLFQIKREDANSSALIWLPPSNGLLSTMVCIKTTRSNTWERTKFVLTRNETKRFVKQKNVPGFLAPGCFMWIFEGVFTVQIFEGVFTVQIFEGVFTVHMFKNEVEIWIALSAVVVSNEMKWNFILIS